MLAHSLIRERHTSLSALEAQRVVSNAGQVESGKAGVGNRYRTALKHN